MPRTVGVLDGKEKGTSHSITNQQLSRVTPEADRMRDAQTSEDQSQPVLMAKHEMLMKQ